MRNIEGLHIEVEVFNVCPFRIHAMHGDGRFSHGPDMACPRGRLGGEHKGTIVLGRCSFRVRVTDNCNNCKSGQLLVSAHVRYVPVIKVHGLSVNAMRPLAHYCGASYGSRPPRRGSSQRPTSIRLRQSLRKAEGRKT